jgi:hypothetical protein
VLDALEAAGYDAAMLQDEIHNQQQRQAVFHEPGGDDAVAAAAVAAAAAGALRGKVNGWHAVVKSLRWSQADGQQAGAGLKGVLVRLVPSDGPG